MSSRINKAVSPHLPDNGGVSSNADAVPRNAFATDQPSTWRPSFAPSADATRYPPHAVYVPAQYEANYAYPLVIWLHADGGSEQELEEVMPALSPQNYLGLAVRGPLPAGRPIPRGFGWSTSQQAAGACLSTLGEVVGRFGRQYNIHSERIYLAGFDQGGTMALRLLLTRPEWFAGAISLSGPFPPLRQPLARFSALRRKRVLLIAGRRDVKIAATEMMGAGRLLHTAGMHVEREVVDAGHERTPEMFKLVNRWVIADVGQLVV